MLQLLIRRGRWYEKAFAVAGLLLSRLPRLQKRRMGQRTPL